MKIQVFLAALALSLLYACIAPDMALAYETLKSPGPTRDENNTLPFKGRDRHVLSKIEGAGMGFSARTASVSIKDYGHLLIQDAGYILSRPLHWDTKAWKTLSLYTAGIGSILLLDDEMYNAVQRNRTKSTSDIAKVVDDFGSAPSFGIMGAFYLGGSMLDNYKAKTVAMDAFAASLVSAGIITTSLKVIAGRSRPEDDEGTYKFQPFGGHHSFPSGHTTQAFSLASVIAEHYDKWWIDTISYGIAGGVGLARVEQEAHFPADVAAGALIGTIVGKTIVRYNMKSHKNVIIMPSADIDGAGLSLKVAF